MVADNKNMNSSTIHRALVFQGGGSLGAYEAGAYKDINEELSRYLKAEVRGDEPIFHIVSGTSIGDKRGYIGKLCEGK
jgi:predicted acylesterase/phospholipase RssA